MSTKHFAYGVDLGGTNMKCGLVDESLEILWRSSAPTRAQAGPEAILDEVVELVESAGGDVNISEREVVGLGVGLPGLVDSDRGTVATIPQLPGWEEFPVSKYLSDKLRMDVKIDHDLRVVTRGEMLCGAARGLRNFCLATVGTGIGVCIVVDGAIYSRSTGDMGHLTIDCNGRPCNCGGIGCLQRYVSASTFDDEIAKALDRGDVDRMISHEELTERARAGERWAKEIFDRAGRCLGFGMLNVVAIINPEKFIIGGGLVRSGDLLLEPAIEVLEKHAYMFSNPRQRIAVTELGDDAGILGAAALLLTTHPNKGPFPPGNRE